MVNEEYANACSEVLEILKYIPIKDYDKIPKNKIEVFEIDSNKNYSFKYDPTKTLDEQNVSKRAKAIIGLLFRDYWATEKQREKIISKQKIDRQKFEEEKREKYDSGKLFKEKNRIIKENEIKQESIYLIEYKEESIFKKIMNKIMMFFKM